jgi:hypothetical protein
MKIGLIKYISLNFFVSLISLLLYPIIIYANDYNQDQPNTQSLKNIFDNNNMSIPDDHFEEVRFGIRITEFKEINNRNEIIPNIKNVYQHTLKGKLLKTNHFYIKNYHIQTIPEEWNETNKYYAVKIIASLRFGERGDVEERLGELKLGGLLKGKRSPYILHALSKVTFNNSFGTPTVSILAGYNPRPEMIGKSKLANKNL